MGKFRSRFVRRAFFIIFAYLILFLSGLAPSLEAGDSAIQQSPLSKKEPAYSNVQFSLPKIAVRGLEVDVKVIGFEAPPNFSSLSLLIDDKSYVPKEVEIKNDFLVLKNLSFVSFGKIDVRLLINGHPIDSGEVLVIPGFFTILPPLLAILFALIFRQVVIALITGVWLGAFILAGYNPLDGLFHTIDHYIKNSLSDPDRAAILLFTTMLGGMIGVVSRMGGTLGVVNRLKKIARNPRRCQIATWIMGLFIFFDDYSNTLIVGNTMRPISDKLKVSREKLSYIVDSTAAPVTSIAVVTTWVGFQISLIATSFQSLGYEKSAFISFVESIPFQFYSILALFFVFFIAFTGRDFGPMLKAERRARSTGKVMEDDAMPIADFSPDVMTPPKDTPLRWVNAVVPILFVIFGALVGLIISGRSNLETAGRDIWADGFVSGIKDLFAAADSFQVLVIVSFMGCILAVTLALTQKLLSLAQSMDALLAGFKSMLMAIIILILAGAIGDLCADMKTADYIADVLRNGIPITILPVITFLVAALISFSTGTSWGTMSILTPLVIPLTFKLGEAALMSQSDVHRMLLISIASIMSGAIFGDHSSPISDTTIMSSIASSSDHIHHVKTQFPYACSIAVVALLFGLLPASVIKVSPVIGIVIGAILLALLIRLLGKPVEPTA